MTYLVSDEKLQGMYIGLKFALENDKAEAVSKLNDCLVELAGRKIRHG